MRKEIATSTGFRFPMTLTYTWMKARFENNIEDSLFFGDVSRGDPVPYVPDNQIFATIGVRKGHWSMDLGVQYMDKLCTRPSCGQFERTDSRTLLDLGVHYQISKQLEIYSVIDNLTDSKFIAARQPYGARPGKPRSWRLGVRLNF